MTSLRDLGSLFQAMGRHPIAVAFASHWRQGYGLTILFIAAFAIAYYTINLPDKAPDFTVFYAAITHLGDPIYSSEFLTPLQEGDGERPFGYPPTFLLLLYPLQFLSFPVAYALWGAATLTVFMALGLQMTRLAWLALFCITVWFATLLGQTTLLMGGLLLGGLALLDRRPVIAGLLFGMAAAIKPQLGILLPMVLLMGRHWQVIGWAIVTLALMSIAATLAFGSDIWAQWIGSLAEFNAINERGETRRLGLWQVSPWLAVGLVPLLIGLTVWAVRDKDVPRIAMAAIGGAMLLSPHTVFYESAILTIPAAAMLRWHWKTFIIVPFILLSFEDWWSVLPLVLLLSLPDGRKGS